MITSTMPLALRGEMPAAIFWKADYMCRKHSLKGSQLWEQAVFMIRRAQHLGQALGRLWRHGHSHPASSGILL